MESTSFSHAFNGRHLTAFRIETEHQAGKNRTPIDQNRASAAFAKFTTMLRSSEIQIFTQDFKQSLMRRERNFGRFTVQNESNVRFLLSHFWFLCEALRLCEQQIHPRAKTQRITRGHAFAPAASCFFTLPNTTLSISRVLSIKTASESSAGRSSI